jgi:hypothetical protein
MPCKSGIIEGRTWWKKTACWWEAYRRDFNIKPIGRQNIPFRKTVDTSRKSGG